ncbi:MAG: DNA polymerase III subunit delta [Armatimonadetes bacterium]|nr:DNA polymerase III subunit delta [Armatimonadota bacterium]
MSYVPEGLRPDAQITLIEGNADVFKQQTVHALATGWLGEELEYGLSQVDAGEVGLEGVLRELGAGTLMSSRRLVVVRDVTALSATEQKQLAAQLEELPEGTAVALVARKDAWDFRRGTSGLSRSLVKVAAEKGQTLQVSGPSPKGLPAWVSQQVQDYGKRIEAEAARLLVETAGTDVDRLLVEVDKLISYTGAREEITEADVREVCVATLEEEVWDFLDAVGQRDGVSALKFLDGMLPPGTDKGAAIMLLGSIARHLRLLWQLRLLYREKVLPGSLDAIPESVAAKLPDQHNVVDAVRGRDWLLNKFTRQARMFSDNDLARALDRVYRADLQLKGQRPRFDERTVMELLVADLCAGGKSREQRRQ